MSYKTSMSCLQQFIQYDTFIFIVYSCLQQIKYFSVCCLDLSRNTQNNIQCNRITHTYPQAHDILQNITTDESLQDEDEIRNVCRIGRRKSLKKMTGRRTLGFPQLCWTLTNCFLLTSFSFLNDVDQMTYT